MSEAQAKAKKANKADRCFNSNGTVRGISYLVKTEKSGTKTPIFQVGIASEADGKIICTSYSINAHGKAEAWKMAVETYAEHKAISKGSKLYKQLMAAMPARPTKTKPRKSAKKAAAKTAKKKVAKKKAAKKKVATKKKVTKKRVKKKGAKKSAVKKTAKKKVTRKKATKKKAGRR